MRIYKMTATFGKLEHAELTLEPGASIGLHTHQGNSEIIYILSGTGKVLYDGAYETLVPGACHYCPEGHEHSLINDGKDELHESIAPNKALEELIADGTVASIVEKYIPAN